MRERFKFKRALDAACYLLKLNGGGKVGHGEMLRDVHAALMYLADREYLRQYGETITGDYPVGYRQGPMLSSRFRPPDGYSDIWLKHIAFCGASCGTFGTWILINETDYGDLCPASCERLEHIHKTYSGYSPDELYAMMRKFPEYNRIIGDDPDAYFKENGWSPVNLRWIDALRDIPQMVFAYIENIEMDEATEKLFGDKERE